MPLYSSEVLPVQPQRLLPTSNSAVFWGVLDILHD